MHYISTRGNYSPISSAQAIKLGMVPYGGLFCPEFIPQIDIHKLQGMNYQNLAQYILKLYLTDYTDEEIQQAVKQAYNQKNFHSEDITPLHFLTLNTGILELWHGPTAAFKDLALQIMPLFLVLATQKLQLGREIVILVATSGDTGKAALEGFRNVKGTQIIVFYPRKGVSYIQELQMITTEGQNTFSVAVEGNFDDCQNTVKSIFGDLEFQQLLNSKGYELSSANSINWGRLVPQIIYYFWAYLKMVEHKAIVIGDSINFTVPTGNFGNILAGYYAYRMGLPIKTFICASNINNVLTDFINQGIYNKKRQFYQTSSPSMDILISSNLERFLFELTGQNANKVNRWYTELSKEGIFKIDYTTREQLSQFFYGGYATEEETFAEIKEIYNRYNYLIDPHTAVGMNVYRKYAEETGDTTPTVINSTASPYKFNRAVYSALTGNKTTDDEFVLLEKLNQLTSVPIHRGLNELKSKEIRHHREIKIDQARNTILEILKIR